MNTTDLDQRLQALLELLETERASRCQAIIDEARQQARRTVRDALGNARARVHQAIVEERRTGEARLRQIRAQIDTRNRNRRHQALLKLVQQSWRPLNAAIQERWGAEASRAEWIDELVRTARARLPRGPWTLHHPPDWPRHERQRVSDELAGYLGQAPRLVADEAIIAGLRIEGHGAVLDGTPHGLLADANAVEARLLALLQPATEAGEAGARGRR